MHVQSSSQTLVSMTRPHIHRSCVSLARCTSTSDDEDDEGSDGGGGGAYQGGGVGAGTGATAEWAQEPGNNDRWRQA
eukprot:3614202-Alexandrium_andersonii.AAC.1